MGRGPAAITVSPDVMAGAPCVRGMRMPVASLAAMFAAGMSAEEILDEHPDLAAGDLEFVHAARRAGRRIETRELPLARP